VKKKGEKMLKKFLGKEKGITGLETAIILIAFVVVAAVFAYTALSAGLFATQKSQEAVYSGLKEAQSTMELKGSVIATDSGALGAAGVVNQISFTVSNVLGGDAIDFTPPTNGAGGVATSHENKVVINYIDDQQEVTDLYWNITKVGNDDGDYMLEAGEKFQINVGDIVTAKGDLTDALTIDNLGVNTTFTLNVVTPSGAILSIERTTPPSLDTINNLR
jgi:archaeal flagellin FlaB